MQEIYISTDIEADGPIPGPHSMLSLGSAAFSPEGSVLSTFTVNLETLPDAKPDPDTEEWWKTQPLSVWEECRRDARPPEDAMSRYVEWLEGFKAKGQSKPSWAIPQALTSCSSTGT